MGGLDIFTSTVTFHHFRDSKFFYCHGYRLKALRSEQYQVGFP